MSYQEDWAAIKGWLTSGDGPNRTLPDDWVKPFGIAAVVCAAAMPLSPGLSTGMVVLMILIYLAALFLGVVRVTPLAALLGVLFAALTLAALCSPAAQWQMAEYFHATASSTGDPRNQLMGRQLRGVLDYWHFLLLPAGIFWAAAGWTWLRRALLALGISAALALLCGWIELLIGFNFRWDFFGTFMKRIGLLGLIGRETLPHPPGGRVMAFFDHPLTFGGFLTVIFFAAAGPALYGWGKAAGITPTGRWRRAAVLLAATGAALSVFAKNRGYWLGGAAGTVILLLWKGRRALLLLAAAALLLTGGAWFASPNFRTRLTGMWRAGSHGERVAFMRSGWEMFKERPLAGWGPRGYRLYGQLYRSRAGIQSANFTHVHNSYLQVAVEGGLLLETAFLLLLGGVAWRLSRRARGSAGLARTGLCRGLLAALAGFMVAALFEWNFLDKEAAIPLFFMLGAALHIGEDESPWPPPIS